MAELQFRKRFGCGGASRERLGCSGGGVLKSSRRERPRAASRHEMAGSAGGGAFAAKCGMTSAPISSMERITSS